MSIGSAAGASRQRIRKHLSSVFVVPTPRGVDRAMLDHSTPHAGKVLYPAPTGSDLKPVHGHGGLPVVGTFPAMARYGSDFFRTRYDRFGPVSWYGGMGLKFVLVMGPDGTQAVLSNPDQAFSNEAWSTRGAGIFFHRGLLMLSFDEHKFHRKIMQQGFTADRLEGYVGHMTPRARETVPSWPVDERFRLYFALKQLTLDVAARAFMGSEIGPRADALNQAFVDCLRGATSLVLKPLPGSRFRAAAKGRALLEDYFRSGIPARRQSDGDDLFSALCHAETPEGESFSDEDIVNHMIFLMMAAHDTATITTSCAAYQLAKHPEWQERAREQSLAMGDEPLDIDRLEQLDVLDLVIKESLRLLAPVPIYMRTAVRDTEILGHHVPARSIVSVAPQVNHFVEECWTAPDSFDPDRFGPDRAEDRSHKYAWIPFGMGAHKCIGMRFGVLEVKVMLHEMLRNFRWDLAGDYDVRWDHVSLPVPSNGLPVRLQRL